MPSVTGVLETSLYVADLDRAIRFYEDLFGFESLARDERFCALSVAGRQVLLLFRQGATKSDLMIPAGKIPGHDGQGETHVAFAIEAAELDAWIAKLENRSIAVESKLQWPHDGWSVYFRDPDRHLVELATPGIWAIY